MDTNGTPSKLVPLLTLVVGGFILGVGLLAMISGSEALSAGLTLAVLGSVLEASGMGSLAFPAARKHLMHVAILAALFGIINISSVIPVGDAGWDWLALMTAGCSGLCTLLFLVFLKGFADARRNAGADHGQMPKS